MREVFQMAIQNDANHLTSQYNETLNQIREIFPNQLHDIRLLNDIADVIIKEQHFSISIQFLKEYENQLRYVTEKQQQRFDAIDSIINEQILAVKKGKFLNEQIIVLSKEVRKTEAGIRTVKLFLYDVIKMLYPELYLVNRIDDCIQYFYKRLKQLENEIAILQSKVN